MMLLNLQICLQKSLGCSCQFFLFGFEEGEKREFLEKIVGFGVVYVQLEVCLFLQIFLYDMKGIYDIVIIFIVV